MNIPGSCSDNKYFKKEINKKLYNILNKKIVNKSD